MLGHWPFEKALPDDFWFEEVAGDFLCLCDVVWFAREDVDEGAVALFGKVGHYVAGLNELYQSVACFVSFSELDDVRWPIRHHLYLFDEMAAESGNIDGAADESRATATEIDDGVESPRAWRHISRRKRISCSKFQSLG